MCVHVIAVASLEAHAELLHHATRPDVVGMVHRRDAVQAERAEAEVEEEAGRLGGDPASPEVAPHSVADVSTAMRCRGDAEPSAADQLGGGVPDDAQVVLHAWLLVRVHVACREERSLVLDGGDGSKGRYRNHSASPPHANAAAASSTRQLAQRDARADSVTG